ncbi:VIR protein [Plasmodium vivax]|uniref:VIR protein n=1 Tax=Plasmodium vivax TaxID=5855 RepID=A0A1G4ED39_PLAVI|nr:VIR protein [Plasmodium vivax]
MTSPNSNPKYIAYNHFEEVIKQYNKYVNVEENRAKFNEIIKNINTERNNLNLPDDLFIKLHKILKNDHAFFYINITDNYCTYVNYWLNDEVRKTYHNVNESNFDIFHKFVVNYNNDRFKKKINNTCYGYIKYLNDDAYRRMTTLYNFYTFFDNLKSYKYSVRNEACEKLLYNMANYNNVINEYYDSDLDLYKKISHVKNLIVDFISNPSSTCKKDANFWEPRNFLRDEQLKKEKEQKEALEREKAQKEALEMEQAQREALKREQDIETSRRIKQMQKTTEDVQRGLNQRDNQMGVGLKDLTASTDLRGQEHSHGLNYPVRSHNLEPLANFREQALTEQHEGQLEGIDRNTENGGTSKDRSFLSSIGFPDSITGVLGQVDPVPVVGVSGGMGALFLLFRYTPVGTFFRGGRGRAHRIPRSFNGQFLGGFPGYEDYDVGHIGYGPMNPLAE